jgi:hypothetical protein
MAFTGDTDLEFAILRHFSFDRLSDVEVFDNSRSGISVRSKVGPSKTDLGSAAAWNVRAYNDASSNQRAFIAFPSERSFR